MITNENKYKYNSNYVSFNHQENLLMLFHDLNIFTGMHQQLSRRKHSRFHTSKKVQVNSTCSTFIYSPHFTPLIHGDGNVRVNSTK